MNVESSSNKKKTINFRVTETERRLIVMAAKMKVLKGENTNTSEYVRESAIKQAEIDLANKNKYDVSKDEMSMIVAALDSPAVKNANLSKLLTEKTILE